jgi:hypothetical protein
MEEVRECPIELNEFLTTTNLKILPLGSYNALISMDWLEKHQSKVDYYNKVVECFDEQGNPREVKGISHPISIINISALQLRKFFKKGFQVYGVHIFYSIKDKGLKFEDYKLLQEYVDMFA